LSAGAITFLKREGACALAPSSQLGAEQFGAGKVPKEIERWGAVSLGGSGSASGTYARRGFRIYIAVYPPMYRSAP
jgi:hypothetical protein